MLVVVDVIINPFPLLDERVNKICGKMELVISQIEFHNPMWWEIDMQIQWETVIATELGPRIDRVQSLPSSDNWSVKPLLWVI